MIPSRYVAGTFNATCDICGFVYKRNRMRKNWKGQLVCREDYEPKHPQLTIHTPVDRIAVQDARPHPEDPANLDAPVSASDLV